MPEKRAIDDRAGRVHAATDVGELTPEHAKLGRSALNATAARRIYPIWISGGISGFINDAPPSVRVSLS
jgi:hypothetical protein